MTEQEWRKIWELFHLLWAQCKNGTYHKSIWNELGSLLQKGKSDARSNEKSSPTNKEDAAC